MNVVKLNDYLSGNRDAIEEILNALDCQNIRYNGTKNEFRCSRDYGTNPSSVKINVDSLRFVCFSTNEQGSIYNLIMIKQGINFPSALKWVCKALNLNDSQFSTPTIVPFGGFYKKLIRSSTEPELSMKTYDDDILKDYGQVTNLSFLQDGIDLRTQEFFQLGYDFDSNRITIPQRNVNGELIGIMGRSNDPEIPYEYRWLPIIPCSRSYTLFGYHVNYAAIQQQQLCIVTESEKGPMQMKSMGYDFGLATCTKSISKVQERYLKALRVKRIVLAYDEGISEEELRYEALKLKSNNSLIYNTEVGYIFDGDGELMLAGSKCSPTDLGEKAFNHLVNKCTKWL